MTERRLADEELRASEERFRLLVEGAADYAIFMLDPEGRVTTWNAGAERMKGYRAEEIIGQHFRVFYPLEARDIRHPEHELELALRVGHYEEEGWRVRKDESRFWANVVITALRDPAGHLVGFGKVTRDITERRAAEQARERVAAELRAANEQLRAASEQTSEFLAMTAHELRRPLVAVTGAAGIMAGHWDELDAAERAETAQNLLRSAARTQRLLDDLVMAARLDVEIFDFVIEDVDVLAAIRKAAAGAGLKDPEAVQIVGDEGVAVRADRTRVVQMVTNLLSNAEAHGTPPVVVEVRPLGDRVEVCVCDCGPCIADDLRVRLFKKFARGSGPDRGTGLGLFIVRALARGQDGGAWHRREGDRTCFGFTLPSATAGAD